MSRDRILPFLRFANRKPTKREWNFVHSLDTISSQSSRLASSKISPIAEVILTSPPKFQASPSGHILDTGRASPIPIVVQKNTGQSKHDNRKEESMEHSGAAIHGSMEEQIEEEDIPQKTATPQDQGPDTSDVFSGNMSVTLLASTPKPGKTQLSRRRPMSQSLTTTRTSSRTGQTDSSNKIQAVRRSGRKQKSRQEDQSQSSKQSSRIESTSQNSRNQSLRQGTLDQHLSNRTVVNTEEAESMSPRSHDKLASSQSNISNTLHVGERVLAHSDSSVKGSTKTSKQQTQGQGKRTSPLVQSRTNETKQHKGKSEKQSKQTAVIHSKVETQKKGNTVTAGDNSVNNNKKTIQRPQDQSDHEPQQSTRLARDGSQRQKRPLVEVKTSDSNKNRRKMMKPASIVRVSSSSRGSSMSTLESSIAIAETSRLTAAGPAKARGREGVGKREKSVAGRERQHCSEEEDSCGEQRVSMWHGGDLRRGSRDLLDLDVALHFIVETCQSQIDRAESSKQKKAIQMLESYMKREITDMIERTQRLKVMKTNTRKGIMRVNHLKKKLLELQRQRIKLNNKVSQLKKSSKGTDHMKAISNKLASFQGLLNKCSASDVVQSPGKMVTFGHFPKTSP